MGKYFTLTFQPRVTQLNLPNIDWLIDGWMNAEFWMIILVEDDPANNFSDDDDWMCLLLKRKE